MRSRRQSRVSTNGRLETFTVGSREIRGLLASLVGLGLPADALLRRAGLARASLDDPDARFREAQILELWLAAEQAWTKGLLGVHAGAGVPPGAFGLTDFLVGSSPTIGAGFRRLAQYAAINNTGLTYEIRDAEDASDVVVSMKHPYAFEVLPPSFVEYLWAILITRFRDHVDARFRPTLRLSHAPQGPAATYRQLLGSVVFNAARSELRIPRAQWDIANPRADADLSDVMERHARDVVERLPRSSHPLHPVRTAIAESMRDGKASIEDVAARLFVTPRTLQRRLAAEGYTYHRALEELRADLASTYLATTALSLTEITYLLAYSDPSAFSRAFKRWTGKTPAEYRRRRGRGR